MEMNKDIEAQLQVLQEIKQLMDTRLGDQLKPKEAAVEVEIKAPESMHEVNEMEGKEDVKDALYAPDDEEKLKALYSKI